MSRPTPLKHCHHCQAINPTGVRFCGACGAEFYRKGRPPLAAAIRTLMKAASYQQRATGCDRPDWPKEVSMAWTVCFRKIEGREPSQYDYANAGMTPPPSDQ